MTTLRSLSVAIIIFLLKRFTNNFWYMIKILSWHDVLHLRKYIDPVKNSQQFNESNSYSNISLISLLADNHFSVEIHKSSRLIDCNIKMSFLMVAMLTIEVHPFLLRGLLSMKHWNIPSNILQRGVTLIQSLKELSMVYGLNELDTKICTALLSLLLVQDIWMHGFIKRALNWSLRVSSPKAFSNILY